MKEKDDDRGTGRIRRSSAEDCASDEIPVKDQTEERLEKLLFGDDACFLDGLKTRSTAQQLTSRKSSEGEDEENEGHNDLGAIADENLFFLDSGPSTLPDDLHYERGDTDNEHLGRKPAWVDSDDDRLYISLASNARLRKLRIAEGEDVINGREYIKRLRRQYERLHPSPMWASVRANRRSRSKRQHSSSASQAGMSDRDVDSDMSLDDDNNDDILGPATTGAIADVLQSAGSLVQTTSSAQKGPMRRKLRPEVLDIQRTKDITAKGPSSVNSLQFHHYYPIILLSGPSSTVSIHHIFPQPPTPNPLLTSLHVKNTPLYSTAFRPPASDQPSLDSETKIYLSSRRRHIHTWSLNSGNVTRISRPFTSTPHLRSTQRSTESFRLSPCGRYIGFIGSARKGGGYVNVLSATTTQWLCTCRIDSRGGVADFAWWRDGNGFVVAGKNGECSEYDVRECRVLGRWMDEGAVNTTVIALGGCSGANDGRLGGDRYVAVGSSSGIVNIYERKGWNTDDAGVPPRPTPLRTLPHLTTPTSHLHFSCDGQMLVMASRWKRDALRLVHLPSCTVYRNWPTDKTPLGRITSVALSPDGSLLAVGNEQGAVRLWEIRD